MDGEEQEYGNHREFHGWPCDICQRNFATKSQYEHHKHNSRNHILCLYCPEVVDFDSEELLHRHCLKNHAQEYCTFCKEHQQDKWHGWLTWHRKLHRLGRWNSCQCGETFVNSYELKEHWRSAPEHRNTYCRHCERNLENSQDLAWHLKNECDEYLPFMPFMPGPGRQNTANPPQGLRSDAGAVRPRLYDIIGVDQSCSQPEVQKAAKRMRVECHPDKLKRKGGLSAVDRMAIDARAQEVSHAADILSDFASRCNYDTEVATGRAM